MLTKVMKAYAYVQYNTDPNIQAFFTAYNDLAQEYITRFATIGLPVYTGLSGDLLSWVGHGLYGVERPQVPDTDPRYVGPYNTWVYNSLPYNGHAYLLNGSYAPASDDIYKRVLTWRLYRGDGKQFTVTWLKRRVARFLYGVDGGDPPVQETYDVGVSFAGGNVVQITVPTGGDIRLVATLAYLVKTGTLELPFQYIFNVLVEGS